MVVTPDFDVIAFDADDTLWHSEDSFHRAEQRIAELVAPHIPDGVDFAAAVRATERGNVAISGFGVKPWILSVIQTTVAVTNHEVPLKVIGDMVDIAHELLMEPVRLIDGVPEVLAEVAVNHRLVMITKGDLVHQQRKAATSGIEHHFERIHVVAEKDVDLYRRVVAGLDVDVDRFLMVGNSVRSDVLPVLAVGGHAVHIPYPFVWEYEHVEDHDEDVVELDSIRALPEYLSKGKS